MTEQDLKEFLETNKAEIASTVKKQVIERLLSQHSWTITQQISAIVNKFVETEVAPEVSKALADQKGPIVSAAIASISAISDELAKGLVADAAKTIANDYRRGEIVKAIFR